jgi:Ca2+-binding RTX toxin-like protein
MALYRFSALFDGQSISFNTSVDVLNFDQSVIGAADIRATVEGTHLRISVASGSFNGKDILLLNVTPTRLTSSNVTFADGSRLLIGDNSTGTTNDNFNNSLVGSAGRDHLLGLGGNDTLNGAAGNDRLDGGDGNDSLLGGDDNDTLIGGNGIDTLNGGLGHDTYVAGSGDVLIDAGGTDTVEANINWTLASGFEHLNLTGTAVVGIGNSDNNFIFGNAQNNSISGREGDDTLWGAGGNDTFIMSMGAGASYGNDSIDGGTGVDTLDYGANARSAVFVNLGGGSSIGEGLAFGGGTGGFGSAQLLGIENANGGSFNDVLGGNTTANFLFGGAGDDTLYGAAGIDRLEGGTGSDHYIFADAPGSANADTVVGFASGADKIVLENSVFTGFGSAGNFIVNDGRFASGAGFTSGRDANDRIIYNTSTGQLFYDADGNGSGASLLIGTLQGAPSILATDIAVIGSGVNGTAGNDSIDGTSGNDTINGLGGNDTINGQDGPDSLVGGDGNDSILGGLGQDTLEGGAGNDTLYGGGDLDFIMGGAGADHFYVSVYPASDAIGDFASGVDKIRLDGAVFQNVGASGNFVVGDERFYSAPLATEAHDSTDRVIYNSVTGDLYYDEDGTGSAPASYIATLQNGASESGSTFAATDIEVINGGAAPVGQSINGTNGSDVLIGTDGNDVINGFGEMDDIDALDGDDRVDGGDGHDRIFAGTGQDLIMGGAGNDILIATDGRDTLLGGEGIDTIEVLGPQSGANSIDGGTGIDTVLFGQSTVIVVDLAAGTVSGGAMGTLVSIESVVGGSANDRIVGDANANALYGGAGNDTVDGGGGNDALFGTMGNDLIIGGAGDDLLMGDYGLDTLTGGSGSDTFFEWQAAADNMDQITDFVSGVDAIRLDGYWLNALGANGRFVAGDARFWAAPGATAGHDADDRLIYNTSTNELFYDADGSGSGNAQLMFKFQAGASLAATDIVVVDGITPAGQTFNGTAGNDSLTGSGGNDTINGLAGNDTLRGVEGNDSLNGGDGEDSIDGGAGNDTLAGLSGHDTLIGGDGDDRLQGAGWSDTMTGGAGADSFLFEGAGTGTVDRVTDFVSGTDELLFENFGLTALGAASAWAAGDARFWSAAGATSGHDADDRLVYNTSTGSLYYDPDGSGAGAAQIVATFQGNPSILASDITVI